MKMLMPLASLLLAGAALAAEPPPPLDAYGDLPAIEEMAIAPDGDGYAVVSRIKGERRIVVTRSDAVKAMAPLGDMKVRGIEWAGDDIVLVSVSATEILGNVFTTFKHEFTNVILVPLATNKPAMVFDNRAGLLNAVFSQHGIRLGEDGEWKGYFGGVELKKVGEMNEYTFDNGKPALFEVDLASNAPRKIAAAARDGFGRDWLIGRNGEVAATLKLNGDTGAWEIENGQGATIASGVNPSGEISLLSFGQTAATVMYADEDAATSDTGWFEVPIAGGTPRELFADANIERLYVDPATGTTLGYIETSPGARPVLFDPAHQAALGKVYRAFPNRSVTVVDWTPDFAQVLVLIRGNQDSGSYYLVDLAQMRADPIGYERPEIYPEHVGPISLISYKAADGMELDGILTLPPDREAKNLPVILFPHGGPHSHDIATFDWWAQAFASRGYAVFQPNFRGSTNRDAPFMRAGYGQWGRKMQTDISDGLAELVKRGVVDPNRACIMGASYGGYTALAGVTLQQGLYRCAVAVAPVSDLSDMYWTKYKESGRSKLLRRYFEASLGDRGRFDEVSPRKHAGAADAPILLIHGKDDTVVGFEQSSKMADALRDAGKPHELVVLRNEDHWLSQADTRKQMLESAMRFVTLHNPPD